jgi:hypothetical protein
LRANPRTDICDISDEAGAHSALSAEEQHGTLGNFRPADRSPLERAIPSSLIEHYAQTFD